MKRKIAPSSASYHYVFFRNLVNDRGSSYRVSIDEVDISSARSQQRALLAAMRRFARRHRVRSWDHLADGYEEYDLRRGKGAPGQ